jgi:hypothetical protein
METPQYNPAFPAVGLLNDWVGLGARMRRTKQVLQQ